MICSTACCHSKPAASSSHLSIYFRICSPAACGSAVSSGSWGLHPPGPRSLRARWGASLRRSRENPSSSAAAHPLSSAVRHGPRGRGAAAPRPAARPAPAAHHSLRLRRLLRRPLLSAHRRWPAHHPHTTGSRPRTSRTWLTRTRATPRGTRFLRWTSMTCRCDALRASAPTAAAASSM